MMDQQKNAREGAIELVQTKDSLSGLLKAMEPQLAAIAPKHLNVQRMLKLCLLAASKQPKLLQCTKQSIAKSIMDAGELGLDFSGARRQGYLVPYWSSKIGAFEAQFQPGYAGLCDLAIRTGKVTGIEAHAVHKNDKFLVRYGTDKQLTHEPCVTEDPGPVVAFYAIAYKTDGTAQFDVMRKSEVDMIRARSKSKDDGPWVTDYEEMGKKTPTKRLCKYLPTSTEMDIALAYDDALEGQGEPLDIGSIVPASMLTSAPPPSRPERLAETVKRAMPALAPIAAPAPAPIAAPAPAPAAAPAEPRKRPRQVAVPTPPPAAEPAQPAEEPKETAPPTEAVALTEDDRATVLNDIAQRLTAVTNLDSWRRKTCEVMLGSGFIQGWEETVPMGVLSNMREWLQNLGYAVDEQPPMVMSDWLKCLGTAKPALNSQPPQG